LLAELRKNYYNRFSQSSVEKSAHVTLVWVRVEGLWIGGHSSHGEGMFNSNNFATSPCLAKVCALLSAILFFCFTFVLRESRTAYETCWRLGALQIPVLLYFTFSALCQTAASLPSGVDLS